MEYMAKVIRSTSLLQTHFRSFAKFHKWRRIRKARLKAIVLMQRVVRGFVARCKADYMRLQQLSIWEQLWDDRRSCLYYYNTVTQTTTYDEPADCYRPLVRDMKSSALMLAWPHLDIVAKQASSSTGFRRPPTYAKGMDPHDIAKRMRDVMCGICNLRNCVRACMDCLYYPPAPMTARGTTASSSMQKPGVHPYCFTCFAKAHSTNAGYDLHVYCDVQTGETANSVISEKDEETGTISKMVKPVPVAAETESEEIVPFEGNNEASEEEEVNEKVLTLLKCCACTSLATRKCLCLLDDAAIYRLTNQLSKQPSNKWVAILKKAEIGGDRKINILFEELKGVVLNIGEKDATSIIDPAADGGLTEKQKFLLSNMLERMRAECDETYCDEHYVKFHANGKRAQHKWLGFFAGAPVCSVCVRSPAEIECKTCDCNFCNACSRTFHGMGRKKKHKLAKLMEDLPEVPPIKMAETEILSAMSTKASMKVTNMKMKKAYFDEPEDDKPTTAAKPNRVKYCGICTRRYCTVRCFVCSLAFCNSCYACSHKAECDAKVDQQVTAMNKLSGPICLVCGSVADSTCQQCGDYYCSQVYMNHPSCFEKYHNKGNRLYHVKLELKV